MTYFNEEGTCIYRRKEEDNFIVPYSPYLLLKYGMHVNVEVVHNIHVTGYLNKYMNKEYDKITMEGIKTDN